MIIINLEEKLPGVHKKLSSASNHLGKVIRTMRLQDKLKQELMEIEETLNVTILKLEEIAESEK